MKLLAAGSYGTLFVAILVALGMFAAKPGPQSQAGDSSATGPRQPILLELFTSEGCSSCPPADRLLEIFDRTQPVAGAELIVLSEHVDYWNRLGWTDPFSSALFTQRQQDYVTRLHLDSAYTPQLVIDGQKDVVGSDERAARSAILKAETHSKASIDLKAQHSGADVKVEFGVDRGRPRGRMSMWCWRTIMRSRRSRAAKIPVIPCITWLWSGPCSWRGKPMRRELSPRI